MKKRFISLAMAAILACTALSGCKSTDPGAADGADYPAGPITIICPWGVGGGADVIARKVAQLGKEYLGQPIVVENHTGASGTIGMGDGLDAAADGYTMVTTTGPLFSLTPKYVQVEYSLEDFTLLKGMRSGSLVWLSNPAKSGMETFDDLIEYGKDHNIKFGTSAGPGGDQYVLATAMFKKMGIQAEAVVYESAAEVINAIVSGQVDLSITTPPTYFDYQQEGTITALACFDTQPLETPFGTVQPVTNWGVDVEFTGMDCFAIRSDVPEDIKQKLTAMLDEVYADEEFISYMEEMGFPIYDADTEELEKFVAEQMENMSEYVELIQ